MNASALDSRATAISITRIFGGRPIERLFELPGPAVDLDLAEVGENYSRIAKAVEMLLAAKLMLLGHHVAIPLEDDGVDLIVDYRVNVQVKSTVARTESGRLKLKLRRSRSRTGRGLVADWLLLTALVGMGRF